MLRDHELPPFFTYVVEVEATRRLRVTLPARSIEAAEAGAKDYVLQHGGRAIVVEEVEVIMQHAQAVKIEGPIR